MKATKRFRQKTYDLGDNYFVEIEIDAEEKTIGAYLWNADCGAKDYMFGINLEEGQEKEAERMMVKLIGLQKDKYIEDYLNEHRL